MAKVTYNSPPDDSPVVEMGGVRFFDGQPADLDDMAHAELIARCDANPHFTVEGMASATQEANDHERESLMAEASELDVKIDGRWGNARIAEEIAAAKKHAAIEAAKAAATKKAGAQ